MYAGQSSSTWSLDCNSVLLTFGFHESPVVWNFMMYSLSTSRILMNDRHQSTWTRSLYSKGEQGQYQLGKGQTRRGRLDSLLLELLDDPVGVELRTVLHLRHKWAGLGFLSSERVRQRRVV